MHNGTNLTETLTINRRARMQRENLADLATLSEKELQALIDTLRDTVSLAENTLRYRRLSTEARV